MGCVCSAKPATDDKALQPVKEMGAAERAFKAALLIQRWYRRYLARIEIRRRCSWNIFQSLEYAGEQDQIKLYEFFNNLLNHMPSCDASVSPSITDSIQHSMRGRPKNMKQADQEERELWRATNPDLVPLEDNYKGPHLNFPLSADDVNTLIQGFKQKKILHAKYVLGVMHEARNVLRCKPNINAASTAITRSITVCGDLHGKLEDLLTVFYKNGMPATDNPYVFNGDFVDRGVQSVETFILLLACMVVWPDAVFLNRGNHEDFSVNIRYGFVKEIMFKYTRHAPRIVQLTEEVYSWLPLATTIDNKVFVVHGGISDLTDLKVLSALDRHQYMTILRPPPDPDNSEAASEEWEQIVDLLWSDPRPQAGCRPNGLRGGGSFFGPDVTKSFLKKHQLDRIIRSHECKLDGHEYTHQGKVLTIFSASNYYDVGSNRGAYVKLVGPNLDPQIVMYLSTSHTRNAAIPQRGSYVEQSALRELRQHVYASESLLTSEFQKRDPDGTGEITVSDWCAVMELVVKLNLPWRLLCPKVAHCSPDGSMVQYRTTFDEYRLTNNLAEQGPSFLESLYRNKDRLETIFRMIDKDGSGLISMDEFTDACHLLGEHVGSTISPECARDLAKSIDINKDGFIDFNEFLEAFRLVDRRSSFQHCMDGSAKCNGQDGLLVQESAMAFS